MSKGHLKRNQTRVSTPTDLVFTAPVVAAAIVDRYSPTGRALDPCEGGGAFSSLIPGCLTREVTKGTDFFAWTEPVDWIVGNPPYSILNEWLAHSFTLAQDIVYLLPIAKVFWEPHPPESSVRLRSCRGLGTVDRPRHRLPLRVGVWRRAHAARPQGPHQHRHQPVRNHNDHTYHPSS